MRPVLVLLLAALAGCTGWEAPVGGIIGADLATVTVFGRGIADLGVSAISGRDCSIVRLDRGETYCAPPTPVFSPWEPYCTQTIGTVTCWADPALVPNAPPPLGDTPAPTLDQLRYRAARWPKSLFF